MLHERHCMETRISTPINETRMLPTDRLVDDFKLLAQRAGEKARDGARAAGRVVHDHPYQTIGVALGVGLLMGLLARWQWKAHR
jgi:ElaB/YqjD/DUF883 family membrane-anchored ribosome-binding protein